MAYFVICLWAAIMLVLPPHWSCSWVSNGINELNRLRLFFRKALYPFSAYVTYIAFRRQHLDLIQKELGRWVNLLMDHFRVAFSALYDKTSLRAKLYIRKWVLLTRSFSCKSIFRYETFYTRIRSVMTLLRSRVERWSCLINFAYMYKTREWFRFLKDWWKLFALLSVKYSAGKKTHKTKTISDSFLPF